MRAKKDYKLIENESHCTVLVKRYMGKASFYPFNEIWERILVGQDNQDTKYERFTYCLQRFEGDTMANWQGREQAVRYVGEDAIAAAEKAVEKMYRKRTSNTKKGRKSWQYAKIQELCKRTGLPTGFVTDVTSWDALFCAEQDPQEFLLCLRENGSHIYSETQDSPDFRRATAKLYGKRAKYFFVTGDKAKELTPEQYAIWEWK